MKKRQSLVCGFLAVILVMALGACSAKGQRLTGGNSFGFTKINNGTAYSVRQNMAKEGTIDIPAYYRPSPKEKYLPVTTIAQDAFYNCDRLISVTIPKGVTIIGESAFEGCSRLTSISIPTGVTSIGRGAFTGCSNLTEVTIPAGITAIYEGVFSGCDNLTSINIPASVTSIGDGAFAECRSLTSVTIPESVTSIGDGAFYLCANLTSINIPASVIFIGDSAFGICSELTGITVDSGNPNYSSDNGVLYNKAKTLLIQAPGKITSLSISANVESINNKAFDQCIYLTSITVDSGNPNFSSESGVLYNKEKNVILYVPIGITSVTIPESVTTIGALAFAYSKITNITIPEGVRSIGERAFIVSALTSVTIQEGLTSIDYGAFASCFSLASINIPDSLMSIGSHAFAWCNSLSIITIPATIRSIGDEAFLGWTASQTINVQFNNDWTTARRYGTRWHSSSDALIRYGQ